MVGSSTNIGLGIHKPLATTAAGPATSVPAQSTASAPISTWSLYPAQTISRSEIDDLYDPQKIMDQYSVLMNDGQAEDAQELLNYTLNLLDNILVNDPGNKQANYTAAVLCSYAGRPIDEALGHMSYILDQDWSTKTPDYEELDQLLFAGSLLGQAGLLEDSAAKRIELFQAVLRTEPTIPLTEHLNARLGLFTTYLEHNHFEEARAEYDDLNQALERVDAKTAALNRFDLAEAIGDVRGAIAAFNQVLANDPNGWESSEVDYDKLSGRLAAVLDPRPEYQKVALPQRREFIESKLAEIDWQSNDISELIDGVNLSAELGHEGSARSFLNRARELNPYSVNVAGLEIDQLMRAGRFLEAVAVYETAPHPQLVSQTSVLLMLLSIENGTPADRSTELMNKYYDLLSYQYQAYNQMAAFFPESTSAWQGKAFLADQFPDGKEIAREAREKALSLLPGEAETSRLQGQLLRQRLFAADRVVIDGKPVAMMDYDPARGIDEFMSQSVPPGTELTTLLANKQEYFFVKDDAAFRTLIAQRATEIGCNPDLKNLSINETIKLAAAVAEAEITYDINGTQKADILLEPIEQKLANGDFRTAVCRHYAAIVAAVFDAVKAVNHNLNNVYMDYSVGPDHAWNTVFITRSDSIAAYVLDATADDVDGIFGNNLGGLQNYRPELFNR